MVHMKEMKQIFQDLPFYCTKEVPEKAFRPKVNGLLQALHPLLRIHMPRLRQCTPRGRSTEQPGQKPHLLQLRQNGSPGRHVYGPPAAAEDREGGRHADYCPQGRRWHREKRSHIQGRFEPTLPSPAALGRGSSPYITQKQGLISPMATSNRSASQSAERISKANLPPLSLVFETTT